MDEDWRTPTQEEKTNIRKAYLDEVLPVIAALGVIIGYIFIMVFYVLWQLQRRVTHPLLHCYSCFLLSARAYVWHAS